MAYSSITKPSLHFNTSIYTGNGSTQSITGVGFQPDFCWNKNRSAATSHQLFDVLRGATKRIYSDSTAAQDTNTNSLTSFDSDGFSVGSGTSANGSGNNIVSWNWKGNGAGSSNSDGDITSTVSANTTAGFSIVKWTSNGSNDGTIGHGLGVAPKIVLYKQINQSASWYWVYKYVDDSLDFLLLNTTDAKTDLSLGTYGFTTSTTITNLGFGNTHELIAYCFAEKKGYSKFGSYVGNNNADGTFVYTGFKPAMVLVKRASSSSGQYWELKDNKRDTDNPVTQKLSPNATDTESSISGEEWDFLSNGFKIRTTGAGSNASGVTNIYMAFAAEPLVANVGQGIPATAV